MKKGRKEVKRKEVERKEESKKESHTDLLHMSHCETVEFMN